MRKMTDENEMKEQAREKKGTNLDSYSIGTSGKEGAWKVYFNSEEESEKEAKNTKVAALLRLKKGIEGL